VWKAVQDARAGRPSPAWRPAPEVFATLPERRPGQGWLMEQMDL
jgi:hypothetical protein